MSKQDFQIIPPDDWFWSEKHKKYVLLSEIEIAKIIKSVERAMDNPTQADIAAALSWATVERTGEKLLQGVLSGRLGLIVPKNENDVFKYMPLPLPPFDEKEKFDDN